ncbi:PLDc N-terminal domain-containing protein [Actinoplanes sp. NPDC048988]|uniref:PLDc N-terminal domain-containing protein n=1 Tax=Actinoplanes sp. NPDC048988 TaxID=3363901 RepID=UPI00371EF3F2
MANVYALLLLLDVALVVCALIDCWNADEDKIRVAPRGAWTFAILLISPFAAIAWFVKGRPIAQVRLRERPVMIAPDDDPEFLASLGKR